MKYSLATGLTLLAIAFVASAQETGEIEKKQIAFAEAALTKAGIDKQAMMEVDNFRFYGSIAKEKATPLAKALARYASTTTKLARYKDDDKPWQGKLTVFVIAERAKYATFVRNNEERRAEGDEKSSMSAKGDTPYVAITTEGLKPGEMETKLIEELEGAILSRKVGATAKFPAWFTEGFHKLVSLKTNPATYTQFKNSVKAKLSPKGMWAGIELRYITGELWPTDRKLDLKDELTLRTSFVDYLLNGLTDAKSEMVLNSFRVTDEMPMPGVMGLAAIVEVKEGESWMTKVEYAWKSWYVTGKDGKELPKKDPKSKN